MLMTVLPSCSSTSPIGTSGFLPESNRLQDRKDLPFKKSWQNPGTDLRVYGRTEVIPVNVEFLRLSDDSYSPKKMAKRRADVAELAFYSSEIFQRAFDKGRAHRIETGEILNSGKAVVCEIAITEFHPSKPIGNVVGYSLGVAGQALQRLALSASGSALRGSGFRGHITIEGLFRDLDSGEVVFMFADRHAGRASIANLKDFQKSAHAKAQLRIWAKQCASTLAKNPDQKIYRQLPIELKPW